MRYHCGIKVGPSAVPGGLARRGEEDTEENSAEIIDNEED